MAKEARELLSVTEDSYTDLGEAELLYVQNKFTDAENIFIKIGEKNDVEDKYLIHCFNRLAQISIIKSDFISAYKYIEASNSINSSNPDTKYLSAKILASEQKYVDALEILNPIVND
jgi:tetratricopeptide (TPR) repeat protein